MSTSTRWYVGAVAAIVVLATVVVLRADEPTTFDPGTPEHAVARYVEALIDSDFTTSDALLTAAARKRCDDGFYRSGDIQRVRITDSRPRPNGMIVEVSITRDDAGDPFASEYTEPDRFVLIEQSGDWLIDSVPWSLCGGK
jgi:hypothetical protein